MTVSVFSEPPKYACRSCGATHLRESNLPGFCAACSDTFFRFSRSRGWNGVSQNKINTWLARKLMLDLKRLALTGVTRRCEAVARGPGGWMHGFNTQCRGHASMFRNGRRVCSQHFKATTLIFAGDRPHDPYTDLTAILAGLARTDVRFRECLLTALADAKLPAEKVSAA